MATVLTWSGITDIVTDIARRVSADGMPNVVIGVLRGGMVPAILLAHAMGVRTVRAIEVLHTVADGVDAAKSNRPQVSNQASLGTLTGLDVVVVDDIAGSGDTIAATVELVAGAGAGRIRSAMCVVNAANWRHPLPPEQALTYIGATVEGWVIFPWEKR
ncbi:phosphoribosyltransferase family protein [Polymorphospora sp. NPDC051019]|uniref:phosphoribosyltransferase n=1 Tax=Polymorphospora sp. NPDC051019 TaxID=3155725 RepID=UPI00341EFFC7